MKTEQKMGIAFGLNLGFALLELIGGILTGSIAILSDALHDVGDASSIGIACLLERRSHRPADARYTYGYQRLSVLGAAMTNLILVIGAAVIVFHAVERMIEPIPIHYDGMIGLSVLGIGVNLAAALLTHGGRSLNEKAVSLHMLEDVLGWIVVLIGAVVMRFTGFALLDPILSVAVAVFLLITAGKGLWETVGIFLERVPGHVDPNKLQESLCALEGVEEVHHLHLWSMDGTDAYCTLHVVGERSDEAWKAGVRACLTEQGIDHATVEWERSGEACAEAECRQANEPQHGHGCHHGHAHRHGHPHEEHGEKCRNRIDKSDSGQYNENRLKQ